MLKWRGEKVEWRGWKRPKTGATKTNYSTFMDVIDI